MEPPTNPPYYLAIAQCQMDWLSSWWTGAPASNLQSSGEISREKLMEFFAKGRSELFASPDFKAFLRQGHEKGRSCQSLVDQAQVLGHCTPPYSAAWRGLRSLLIQMRAEFVPMFLSFNQMQLWESIGVYGQYGVKYLARLRTLFANDAEMMRTFYE